MAMSEAHSTVKSLLAVCATFASTLLAHKRSELPSHRAPVPQILPPLSPTFPVHFIFLSDPTFPHIRPPLLFTAPVSDSHFSRHCPLVALPTCYSLPPTITPFAASAYCNILQCTVRRLSLPAPSIFSSHHHLHPVLKSPLRSPS